MTLSPHLIGELFEAVQRRGVFEDSKTFVDTVPLDDPETIRRRFRERRTDADFDLDTFVHRHFAVDDDRDRPDLLADRTMEEHVRLLWGHLTYDPGEHSGSSLISLSDAYVIPGGRFRELYYWDSYFTAEGLAVSDRYDLIEGVLDNFASLVDRFGFVPTANREYYTSRSQPPLFYRTVDVLARERGVDGVRPYLDSLALEHRFWMDGEDEIDPWSAHRRTVRLDDAVLNRYWDDLAAPRKEAYREDVAVADMADRPHTDVYRNVRAACESGWDFSSRWFEPGEGIESVHTTELVPVDLNAFLFGMERRLAVWFAETGHPGAAAEYEDRAAKRRRALDQRCWDADRGFYFDFRWTTRERTDRWTLAAVAPLFVGAASTEQAAAVAERLRGRFLAEGGLTTTLTESGEQWDRPNGWAPLHWMAVVGLERYGHGDLAAEVADRWLATNRTQFERSGKMLEKYDVRDPTAEAGGGEYELQDGFGWTNGVALALIDRYSRNRTR